MRNDLLLRLAIMLLIVSIAGAELRVMAYLALPEGCVAGVVFYDANENGVFDQGFEWTLSGVQVQLENEYGTQITLTSTDAMGFYVFTGVTGAFSVDLPLMSDWTLTTTSEPGLQTIVFEGETASGPAFGVWTPVPLQPPSPYITIGPTGHTIGFWKTNIGKLLYIIGGRPQVNEMTMRGYLAAIGLAAIGEEFGATTEDRFLQGLDLYDAYGILCVDDSSEMRYKAQAQILGLLLSEQYYGYNNENEVHHVYLPDIGQGGDFAGEIQGAIRYILDLYDNGQYAAAKNLADTLNNMSSFGVNIAAHI